MGCDIHLKLEQRRICRDKDGREIPSKRGRWETAGVTYSGEFSERIYSMFARLADVRNYEDVKSLEVRGFPEDASTGVKEAYGLRVIDDEDWEKFGYDSPWREEKAIKRSEAEELSKERNGIWMNVWYEDKPDYIKDLWNWHTPSWCTTEEMEWAIKKVFWNKKKKRYEGSYVDWTGLLGAMKGIEADGNYECRAVFWFDS